MDKKDGGDERERKNLSLKYYVKEPVSEFLELRYRKPFLAPLVQIRFWEYAEGAINCSYKGPVSEFLELRYRKPFLAPLVHIRIWEYAEGAINCFYRGQVPGPHMIRASVPKSKAIRGLGQPHIRLHSTQTPRNPH